MLRRRCSSISFFAESSIRTINLTFTAMLLRFILFLILGALLPAQAKTIFLNNASSLRDETHFPKLSSAYDACNSGDTIRIEGTSASGALMPYTGADDLFVINKKIHLIGPGISANAKKALFASLYLGTGADQTLIEGCEIEKIAFMVSQHISVITLRSCVLGSMDFSDISNAKLSNLLVFNCVITGSIDFAEKGANLIDCIFKNNLVLQGVFKNSGTEARQLFFLNNNFVGGQTFSEMHNILCSNNLFLHVKMEGCSNSTFNNNLLSNCGKSDFSHGNNTGHNNRQPENPGFSKIPDAKINLAEALVFPWRISSGSEASGTATDGGDIGLRGMPCAASNLSEEKISAPSPAATPRKIKSFDK